MEWLIPGYIDCILVICCITDESNAGFTWAQDFVMWDLVIFPGLDELMPNSPRWITYIWLWVFIGFQIYLEFLDK